jgi:hypothetical protein
VLLDSELLVSLSLLLLVSRLQLLSDPFILLPLLLPRLFFFSFFPLPSFSPASFFLLIFLLLLTFELFFFFFAVPAINALS